MYWVGKNAEGGQVLQIIHYVSDIIFYMMNKVIFKNRFQSIFVQISGICRKMEIGFLLIVKTIFT